MQLLNSPDDTPSERAGKFVIRQCCIMPVIVLVIVGVVFLVIHH